MTKTRRQVRALISVVPVLLVAATSRHLHSNGGGGGGGWLCTTIRKLLVASRGKNHKIGLWREASERFSPSPCPREEGLRNIAGGAKLVFTPSLVLSVLQGHADDRGQRKREGHPTASLSEQEGTKLSLRSKGLTATSGLTAIGRSLVLVICGEQLLEECCSSICQSRGWEGDEVLS